MVCWHHARGGEGAVDLAKAIVAACEQPTNFQFLYPLDLSIKVCILHFPAPAGVQALLQERLYSKD